MLKNMILVCGKLFFVTMATLAYGNEQLANPASAYCVGHGGQLEIAQLPSGDEYGICVFDDNRQCEEWALFRGICPMNGLRVTGYNTPDAVYCVITGGTYEGRDDDSLLSEQRGTCALPGGNVCAAFAYYNGSCG